VRLWVERAVSPPLRPWAKNRGLTENQASALDHGRLIEHQPAWRFFDQPESDAARAFMAGGLVL
jgi:hypothetical protein